MRRAHQTGREPSRRAGRGAQFKNARRVENDAHQVKKVTTTLVVVAYTATREENAFMHCALKMRELSCTVANDTSLPVRSGEEG